MSRTSTRAALAAATLTGTVLALCACGGSDATSSAAASSAGPLPSVRADQALADRVPESVTSDGTLTIGSDTTYAPSEFLAEDGTTPVGFEVDLFTLVAQELGLDAEFETASFDSIIAGVRSGRYEAGVSSFSITADRVAQADMVSYFRAGTQWATQAGNPEGVDPADACGLAIAVMKGATQVDDLTARSQACTDAGEPEITIDQYDGQDEATAAVVSGKDVAGLADSPVVAYAVQQTGGRLELLGDVYESAPYGVVLPQDQGDFAQAVADAVQALMDDGSYARVLAKWGVEGGAIDDPTVDPTVG